MSHDHDSWYIDATSCTCMKYELLHLPGTVVLPPLWNWVYFGTKIPKRVGYSDPAKFVQQLNDLQILWMERSAEIWKLQTIFFRGFWVQYCIPIPTESKWKKKVNKEKKLKWVYLRPRPRIHCCWQLPTGEPHHPTAPSSLVRQIARPGPPHSSWTAAAATARRYLATVTSGGIVASATASPIRWALLSSILIPTYSVSGVLFFYLLFFLSRCGLRSNAQLAAVETEYKTSMLVVKLHYYSTATNSCCEQKNSAIMLFFCEMQ